MKIHKTKMLPTILVTFIIVIGLSLFSFYYIMTTSIQNFSKDCKSFDDIVSSLAVMSEQSFNRNLESIELYSNILRKIGFSNEEAVISLIKDINQQNLFQEIALLTEDNYLYYDESSNELKNVSNEFKDTILHNKNSFFQTTINSNKYFIYKIGFTDPHMGNCVLFGLTDVNSSFNYLGDEFKNKDTNLYILDHNDNLITSIGEINTNFSIDSIPQDTVYIYDEEKEDRTDRTFNYILKSFSDFGFTDLNEFKFLSDNDSKLWFIKELQLADDITLKLVVSKRAAFSEESKNNIVSTSLLLLFVFLSFIALMLTILIIQGLTNRKLIKMAYLDQTTKWYNWNKFKILSAKRLKKRKQQNYALVTFDIRNFKLIKDLDGHRKGQNLLLEVNNIIKKWIQKQELFSRYASDEFVLLLTYKCKEDINTKIQDLNQLLISTLNLPTIHFNYGVFYIDDYKKSIDRMQVYASIAKDQSKQLPNHIIGTFTDEIHNKMHHEQQLEASMEQAILNKEFKVYLQPKYRSNGAIIEGAEALVRWIHPNLGFISPGDFIPLFETNGFILQLDCYMLQTVCEMQRMWLNKGNSLITISVNISRAHMMDSKIIEDIVTIVDSYELPHNCIELELTESAFFEDNNIIQNAVNKLRSLDFLVSMDDFGSGYSSLNSLKDLSLDIIKLDGEFFKTTNNTERSKTVIKDTISLAKHLEMKIVAEGIETKEQVDFLHDIGCDLIQGYYFAKPMPVNEFELLMNYK